MTTVASPCHGIAFTLQPDNHSWSASCGYLYVIPSSSNCSLTLRVQSHPEDIWAWDSSEHIAGCGTMLLFMSKWIFDSKTRSTTSLVCCHPLQQFILSIWSHGWQYPKTYLGWGRGFRLSSAQASQVAFLVALDSLRLEPLEREKEHTKQQLAETQRDLAAADKGSDSYVRLEKRKDRLEHRVLGIGKIMKMTDIRARWMEEEEEDRLGEFCLLYVVQIWLVVNTWRLSSSNICHADVRFGKGPTVYLDLTLTSSWRLFWSNLLADHKER